MSDKTSSDDVVSLSQVEYSKLVLENQNLKKDIAKIAQQLPRLRQLIEYSADAMILHDGDGIIVDCNQRAAEMLAMDRDDVYEQPLMHFLGDLPQIMFEQVNAKPVGTSDKFMGSLLRNDDVSVPVEINITAFNSNDERMYVSSIRDVSDRLQQESALSESQNKLSQANVELSRANERLSHLASLKDQFLANMSHELRTPLNAVMGLSEALQHDVYGSLTDKQRASLQTIYDSGKHLLELINDVLDLSKIEAEKMELQFENISLRYLSEQCLALVRSQLKDKSQQLTFNPSRHDGLIKGDARRIKQVIINLLSNAIKFTPEGGDIGIDIVIHENDSTIALTVWDEGKGISEQQKPLLFEPFVQLEEHINREHEGTGLGLALVSRLVEMHDGRVEVESEIDQGSRFTIIFPLASADVSAHSEPPSSTNVAASCSEAGNETVVKRRVLVVEDKEANIGFVCSFLELIGCQVDVAVNGLEGLDKATELLPDIILLDIQMPGINGYEVMRRLRSNERTKGLRIIAMTGMAMEKDKQDCFEAGANAYLSKPYSLKALEKMIGDLLSDREVID